MATTETSVHLLHSHMRACLELFPTCMPVRCSWVIMACMPVCKTVPAASNVPVVTGACCVVRLLGASQGGLCSSPGTGGASGFSAADLALASQIGLPTSSSAAGALSAAAAASRGAFGEGPRIYVGGVPDLVTVAMVRDHFSRWGVVSCCWKPSLTSLCALPSHASAHLHLYSACN